MKLIEEFAKTVSLNKGRAYYVGGTVRDSIMGTDVKDVDIEVHGIEAPALRRIVDSHFKDIEEIGEAFGVLHTVIEGINVDVSLPRRDSKTGPGHKGFDVNVDPNMSPEDALKRRDFTVNALLKDVLTGGIIDPFGGKKDIDARILRVVDEDTFAQDPLRVLRAVQLAGRFEFTVEDNTIELLKQTAGTLKELSLDRHREEWRKLFLKASKPSIGLELARLVGVFDNSPIIEALLNTVQDPEWHPEGDVWTHTKWVCDEAALICEREGIEGDERLTVVLGALCHDLGKPETTQEIDGRIRSHGHSHAGLKHTGPLLRTLGLSKYEDSVKPIVLHHLEPYQLYKQRDMKSAPGDGAFRSLARRMRPSNLAMLSYVSESDMAGRGPYSKQFLDVKKPESMVWFRNRAHELQVRDTHPPDVIGGNELIAFGMNPGPSFGLIVKAANILQDDHGLNREEILERIRTNSGELSSLSVQEIVEKLK